MKNKEKSDNRKALPKFLLWMLAGGLAGGLCGGLAGFLGGTSAPEAIVDAIYGVMTAAAPWSITAVTVVMGGLGLLLYRRAKALFAAWDGEDEDVMDRAEEQLSWALLCSSLNLILDFFFLASGICVMEPTIPGWQHGLLLLSFVLSMAVVLLLQQKVVDLTKRMNPEKRGSVYDLKFQKTWLASCDENEQRQIGQAAMKAFTAVNISCIVLWAALVLLSGPFHLGLLPFFLVTLIWGVSQVAYCLEAIRLGRHKEEVR